MTRAAEILSELVAIPSVSNVSNRPVIEYAEKLLTLNRAQRHGQPVRWKWHVEKYPYRDAEGIEKINLIATTKPGKSAELALVCHTDTVPYDPEWKQAVHPEIRGGKLYGRGSCDVKGFLACILAAIESEDISRFAKPLAMVLTADEETGCVGAKFLARKKALKARYTIIGEPTDLHPVRAGKGYALLEITVRGKEAHSAFPARGRSAIYDAARVVAALERVAKKLAGKKDRAFDPPYTTLNAGLIQGGTAKNIVAGECRITVEWRPIPGQKGEWAADLIREELTALKKKFPGLDATLDVKRIDPAFAPSANGNLVGLIESLTGRRAMTVSFGTEAAHLSGLSQEVIVFGAGDMTTAHRTGEHVKIADLDRATRVLCEVMKRVLQ